MGENGTVLRKEISEIEKRKDYISEAVGNVDEKLESSFKQLGQLSKEKVDSIAEKVIDQNDKLDQVMSQQQEVLESKLYEMADAIEKRNQRLTETFNYLDQIVTALPEQMKQSSSELSNLPLIKQGIEDLQKTMEEKANNRIITETGKVVAPPKQKFPIKVKIAIYIIAFCCLIQIIKEIVLFVIKIAGIQL